MYHRNFTNNNAFTTAAWYKVWDASNDGSGSGLDADLLDGSQGNTYMKGGAGAAVTGWWINGATNGNSGSPRIYFSHSSGYGQHINTYNTDGSVYALELHNNSTELFKVMNDGQVRIPGQLRIGAGSNDGYFYSDSNGRTAFTGGDFYIQSGVSNYYNYATNQYIGDSSGDNIYFRGNTLTGNSWSLSGAGALVTNTLTTNSTAEFTSTVVHQDNQVFRQEGQFTTNTSGQNTNSGDKPYSFGYQIDGAWSHPYPDLIIGYHTGMRFGGHTNYGGCRFYGDHPSRNTTIVFSTNNGDLHVRAANNIYAYTSDKRLKENFRPIENAVDKVKALGGFIFDWRKDMMDKHVFTPDQEKNDAGLIAQEVQKVMPAAIRRAPFDYDPNEPNQSKSGEEFLTVQYEKMVPLLVEAIKEQQKQIDELKKLLEEKE